MDQQDRKQNYDDDTVLLGALLRLAGEGDGIVSMSDLSQYAEHKGVGYMRANRAILRLCAKGQACQYSRGHYRVAPKCPVSVESQMLDVAEAMREWIDAVPSETPLPSMPGFDRDWADRTMEAFKQLIRG